MDDKNQKKDARDSLVRVYQVLKFSPEEIKEALKDFNDIYFTALLAQTLGGLPQDEANELKTCFSSSDPANDPQRIKAIVEKYFSKDEFKVRAAEVAQKTLKEYIDYLKSRGDDFQKEEIKRILADL